MRFMVCSSEGGSFPWHHRVANPVGVTIGRWSYDHPHCRGTHRAAPRVGGCGSPRGTSTPSGRASTGSRRSSSATTSTCSRCQETKAREDQLPLMGLQAAGYDVAAAGTNQWNGVAIISRVGLDDVTVGFDGMPGYGEPLAAESRAIGATCGGVRIWSLYVPNGRKPDDPHYVYKLDWLARLREARRRLDGRPDGAGRRLEHLPDRRRRLRPGAVQELHARHAAGARGVPGVPRRRVRRGHPRLRARLHLLGLLPAAVRARPRASRSTSSSPRRRWRGGSPARSSTARNEPARARPTTPRSSSTWPTERAQHVFWKLRWSTQVTVWLAGARRGRSGRRRRSSAAGRRGRRAGAGRRCTSRCPGRGSHPRPGPACFHCTLLPWIRIDGARPALDDAGAAASAAAGATQEPATWTPSA